MHVRSEKCMFEAKISNLMSTEQMKDKTMKETYSRTTTERSREMKIQLEVLVNLLVQS